MRLSNRAIDQVLNIVQEPVHECGIYDSYHKFTLIKKIEQIVEHFEKNDGTLRNTDVIKLVNDYIKSTVKMRSSYFSALCGDGEFDLLETYYRTAHAALYEHEAMCSGYTEAVRCLLAAYDKKSYTLVTKLPGVNKQLLHYVCVVIENGYPIVLDPERQANCEYKGYDFDKYLDNMIYIIPGTDFAKEKIGKTGVGIKAEDYLERPTTVYTKGRAEIIGLINQIEEEQNGRVYCRKK